MGSSEGLCMKKKKKFKLADLQPPIQEAVNITKETLTLAVAHIEKVEPDNGRRDIVANNFIE